MVRKIEAQSSLDYLVQLQQRAQSMKKVGQSAAALLLFCGFFSEVLGCSFCFFDLAPLL